MASEEPLISNIERAHILRCLVDNTRPDGRFHTERRRVRYTFSRSEGSASAEVQLGQTRVVAIVTASIVAPFPDRPLDGILNFFVNVSSMSSPAAEGGRPSAESVQLSRMLERQVRGARAIDTEALCIEPGERVWNLRVDAHVLDDGGNLTDACALASMAALLHFRRADVSVRGHRVIVHSYTERAPVPLAVHHIPLCITFGCFEDPAQRLATVTVAGIGTVSSAPTTATAAKECLLLDPTDREELVSDGSVTFIMNAHQELCGVHKLGGCAIAKAALLGAAKLAGSTAATLVSELKTALAAAETEAARRAADEHAIRAGFAPRSGVPPGFVEVAGGAVPPQSDTSKKVGGLRAHALDTSMDEDDDAGATERKLGGDATADEEAAAAGVVPLVELDYAATATEVQ